MSRWFLPLFITTLLCVSPSAASGSDIALEIPAGAQSGPQFDVERATQAYIDLLSPAEKARSDAYFEGGYVLLVIGLIYQLLMLWLLLRTRLSARMRARAQELVQGANLRAAIYACQYIIITSVFVFPLTVYREFFREHSYGLATQSFFAWMVDQAKGLVIGLIFGVVGFCLLYAVIRRFPRWWWMGGAAVGMAMLSLMLLIAPVFLAPMFNAYQPLEEGPVRERILAMARTSEVPTKDVYWFDASQQTTRISANVSGLGSTMRISLNDNLLKRTSEEEIAAVMGHEIGHYVLNHVWSHLVSFALILLVALGFTSLGLKYLIRRYGDRWHVRGVDDPAGFPILAGLVAVFFFFMTPVTNTIIRTAESEADRFGLDLAQEPDGFARVAMRLSDYRKIDPHPIEEFLFYDHPSGRTRVEMAMRWKAQLMLNPGAESEGRDTNPVPLPQKYPANTH